MRIPILGVDERFENTEDVLEYILRFCNLIVEKAKQVCPNPAINDIPSYALEFIHKVLIQASTMVKISRDRKDYNTVCALVRILADNIASINLIYGSEYAEEKALRHFLYIIDGVSLRYKLLTGHPMHYDGTIPQESFDALKKQVQGAKENADNCIYFCTNAIKMLPVYVMHGSDVDIFIKTKNWKFKTVNKPKESYTWKEMYGMLNIKEGKEMFSFFSQYVHGLSVSNIATGNKDDFQAPLSFAVCLVGWLFNFLRKEYEPHIEAYTMADIKKLAPELFE